MSPIEIGYICLALLFVLLFIGAPVGVVMGSIGVLGMVWISGIGAGIGILKTVPNATLSSYDYSVFPLFILMGEVMFHSGIAPVLVKTIDKFLGRVPGRLSLLAVGSSCSTVSEYASSLARGLR